MGKPDEGGKLTVSIGESDVDAAAAVDTHLTGEGVAGCGGSVAGESNDCVAVSTAVGRLGGMMK